MAHSCCPSRASVPSTSSWHHTRSDGGRRARWGTEVEKGGVRPARARLPWALLPPFFLYWSISSGPGGGRRGGEESEARWLPSSGDPILFSLAETSAPLLTNGEQRPRAACGKGKLLAPLDLDGSCLLLNLSSCHLFTFFCLLSPIFFPSS